jgi:hypothetical protein
MSSLPDLRTEYVAQIGYWNANNHGATSVSSADVLEYNSVESWVGYDNGLEGGLIEHPALRFRVKDDGWVLVYFDVTHGDVNPEDFLTDFDAGSQPDLTETALSRHVDSIREHVAPDADFAHGDVGLYNYRYPDMNHYRVMHAKANQYYGESVDGEYAFNPAAPGPYHYVIHARGSYGGYVQFDGNDIVTSSSSGPSTNTARVADAGWIDTPGYYYPTTSWVPLSGDAEHTTLVVE